MKITRAIYFFSIVFALFSFAKPEQFEIKCTFSGFPDSTKFYLENMRSQEIVDSAYIINGKMIFTGVIEDAPERLLIHCMMEQQLKYVDLLIGNERVNIQGDVKDLQWNSNITGSKPQKDKNYIQGLTKIFDIKRDSLTTAFMNLSKEMQKQRRKEIWDEVRNIDDSVRKIRIEYLWSHLNTYQGLIILGDLKNSLSKDTVQMLYDRISPDLKTNKYSRIVEIYLKEKISSVGDKFHDFEAMDELGKQVKLSDFFGNYILLDFTSTGCMPCIKSIKELKLIDKTYSDSLTIVSFSCDKKKDLWLTSIKRDSITWVSLWDGKGSYSDTYIKYGVSSLPSFFLVDPNGIIIEKWSGFDEGYLTKKLSRFKKD